jgi:hypothetical protein
MAARTSSGSELELSFVNSRHARYTLGAHRRRQIVTVTIECEGVEIRACTLKDEDGKRSHAG